MVCVNKLYVVARVDVEALFEFNGGYSVVLWYVVSCEMFIFVNVMEEI